MKNRQRIDARTGHFHARPFLDAMTVAVVDACPICLEALAPRAAGDLPLMCAGECALPHWMHFDCFFATINADARCPVCRVLVRTTRDSATPARKTPLSRPELGAVPVSDVAWRCIMCTGWLMYSIAFAIIIYVVHGPSFTFAAPVVVAWVAWLILRDAPPEAIAARFESDE